MIGKGEARLLSGIILKPRYEYIESSFSVHQQHVISLLIHGFLSVNARLLIAFGTAFYAITLYYGIKSSAKPAWETAVHLAVAGGVFDGVFCAVLFPTRCLG